MATKDFESREIDPRGPSAARLYHYYLTGEPVFDADKLFAERVFARFSHLDTWAHHNRDFLGRATRFMAEHGIRQFLDIGSGLPTGGNTHEVARARALDARVVYVDNDMEAVNRAHDLLLHQNALGTTAIVEADLRRPDLIFDHPETRRLIDIDQPVGLLIVSVWPFVPESARPLELMASVRDRLPSGSYAAMTHVSLDDASIEIQQQMASAAELYDETSDPVTLRSRAQFSALFDGFELVEPGITYAPDWRPDQPVDVEHPARPCNFAAVGYTP